MGIFDTAADISRADYIIRESKSKKACLDFLKVCSITNKDEILKSYKKELHLQMYPCLILVGLMCVSVFLLLYGENKGQAGPYAGAGLIMFITVFTMLIIWLIITSVLFKKEPYTQFYRWFISAEEKSLEKVLDEPTVFKDGYPKSEVIIN